MLTNDEMKAFDEFVNWLGNNDWVRVKQFDAVYLVVKVPNQPKQMLQDANYILTRLLENLNLRQNTREVFTKIQFAIDKQLDGAK